MIKGDDMDIQKFFSNNLRYYLEMQGKTQTDLAKHLNVSTAMTSMWCNGANFPRADKIMMIAKYLGINFIELFTDNNSKDKEIEDIIEMISQLDDEYRNIIREQSKTLLKIQKSK